jgi:pilus assembly protein FimV
MAQAMRLAWVLTAFAGTSIHAATLGNAPSSVPLGQALDIAVPLRLEPGEDLPAECLQVEVWHGEQRLPASQVRARATASGHIRINTNVALEEPVVQVQITAGCSARVQRRYTMFVDPVAAPAAAPPVLAAAERVLERAPERAAERSVEPTRPSALPAPGLGAGAAADGVAAAQAEARARSRLQEQAQARELARERARVAALERQERRRAERQAQANAPAAPPATARAEATRPRPSAEARPRLRLDPADALPTASITPVAAVIEDALQAVTEAASSVRASAAAASAAAAKAASLEAMLNQMRSQAAASQAEYERLRASSANTGLPSTWLWPMALLLAGLTVLALWLAFRIRGMQQAQDIAWARASAMAQAPTTQARLSEAAPLSGADATGLTVPGALQRSPGDRFVTAPGAMYGPASLGGQKLPPLPLPPDTLPPAPPLVPAPAPVRVAGRPSAAPVPPRAGSASTAGSAATAAAKPPMTGWEPMPPAPRPGSASDAEPALARTQVLPAGSRADDKAPRDVSIEELIDVDQQAEFFIALGQDHAAIDLLVAHLRQTGGGSPLTYLKLLEVYQRLDDQENYERTRVRFNQRYNAYAPEWGTDLASGRWLVDYPSVLPRIQAAWRRPLDAMAELEALLFRKSRGELFELPAYRDVLFLYAMARGFHEQEAAVDDRVDLLLPLERGVTPPARVGDARAAPDHPLDDQPTAPLDLDLTPPTRPDSIFGDPLVPSKPPRSPDWR